MFYSKCLQERMEKVFATACSGIRLDRKVNGRSIFALFFGLTLVLSLVGCSGVPSESNAKDVYASNLDKSLVVIDSFTKVNAIQGERDGVKFYDFEYRAKIKWPKGLNTQCLGNDEIFMGWDCNMVATRNVGQVEERTGKIHFIKTEKGWIGEKDQAY